MEKILIELQSINEKIEKLHLNQINLNKKIDKVINDDLNKNIDKSLNELKVSANIMNTHISFIENVYDTIKNPFYFILNKVSKIENVPEKQKEIKYFDEKSQ
jgi:hypothetical protein